MTGSGRRSDRFRKSLNYSKLSSGNDGVDGDDDDFMEKSQPNKRKKRKTSEDNTLTSVQKRDEVQPVERKARNRLSEEEKYNLQLEEALKLSIMDTSKMSQGEITSKTENEHIALTTSPRSSQKDIATSEHAKCVPLTIRVDVMDSPMSKMRRNQELSKSTEILSSSSSVSNGAVLPGNDRITPLPMEDIKVNGLKRRSSRKVNTKQEEEEYQLSEETESDEDVALDDDETFEDFQNSTPRRKVKRKTLKIRGAKENNSLKTVDLANSIRINKRVPSPEAASSSKKILSDVLTKSAKTLPLRPPITPTTARSKNILSVRSPSLVQTKFVHPGWTPPGPAGTKSNSLKSSLSPSCIRVGLSRNARISPLHPRTNIQ